MKPSVRPTVKEPTESIEFVPKRELDRAQQENKRLRKENERLKQETASAGLAWRKVEAFGQSYAETLHAWADRFSAKWREISAMGFDERFKKLWLFYLGYCEAGFRTGRTDVIQLALAKPAA